MIARIINDMKAFGCALMLIALMVLPIFLLPVIVEWRLP